MVFDPLKDFISSYIHWLPSEQSDFLSQLSLLRADVGTVIVNATNQQNKLYFVNKGALCTMLANEKDLPVVLNFSFENSFTGNWAGYISGLPDAITIQAVEETEYVAIPYSAMNWFYENVSEGNKFGRFFFTALYTELSRRNRLIHLKSPLERYKQMLRIYPGIDERLSQRLISAYIGVDPAHFSRLRLKNIVRE